MILFDHLVAVTLSVLLRTDLNPKKNVRWTECDINKIKESIKKYYEKIDLDQGNTI